MEIHAKTRTELGKKSKSLRKAGFVPAELFGHGIENKHISVSAKEFSKIYEKAGENTVLTLVIDDKEKTSVLISDVQFNNLSQTFISADFRGVKKDEKITVAVPIEYIGVDMASKNELLLVKVLDEIEIEAFPDEIPHSFIIDITPLDALEKSIEIKDITVPKGVKIMIPEETVLVTVTEKAQEEPAEAPPSDEESTSEETEKDAKTEKEESSK